MRKIHQNEDIDTNQPTVPEVVSVALTELIGEVQEGLLALAVGAGLQALTALMEADVTTRCGVKGRHDATRTATRHGHECGSVILGGRRVPVVRRGCPPVMARASCRCRPMSCLARPRSWVGWRWSACLLGYRRDAIRSDWSRWGLG